MLWPTSDGIRPLPCAAGGRFPARRHPLRHALDAARVEKLAGPRAGARALRSRAGRTGAGRARAPQRAGARQGVRCHGARRRRRPPRLERRLLTRSGNSAGRESRGGRPSALRLRICAPAVPAAEQAGVTLLVEAIQHRSTCRATSPTPWSAPRRWSRERRRPGEAAADHTTWGCGGRRAAACRGTLRSSRTCKSRTCPAGTSRGRARSRSANSLRDLDESGSRKRRASSTGRRPHGGRARLAARRREGIALPHRRVRFHVSVFSRSAAPRRMICR